MKADKVIDPQTQKSIDSWLEGDYDAETKESIRQLQQENPQEIIDAFYKTLSFGTGGMRGKMGVGTNRMNFYTIRAATQGLANYLLLQPIRYHSPHRVCIAFDCRHNSHAFALEAAKVLAANGIEVFIYRELRPVASVSFGVLHLKCNAGIMITASHNPPEYNGYKVYWSYGGQVLPPQDEEITQQVNSITSLNMVKVGTFPHTLIHEIGEETDKAYLQAIHPCQLHLGDNQTHGQRLKIVYTSLHGAGITMIPPTLREWGFTHLNLVQAQAKPDGNFPTVKTPNPEEHEALSLGIKELLATQSDLLIGTDPDTDRLGVVALYQNKPFFFDGNQVACLLLEHLCHSLRQTHQMPPKAMCIKTIVTTELLSKIANHYRIGCLDVLTGFKYVGEKIHQWEEEKKADVVAHHFLLGAEESYGYLIGTHVRDKDAVVAAACICEAALQMKLQGKTLVDLLHEIYMTYGVYREKLLSLTYEGKKGAEKIESMMTFLRKNPLLRIEHQNVSRIEDYAKRTIFYPESGHIKPLLLPVSDVLRFWLEDGTKIVVRPSGTEPKIKLYCGVLEKHHHPDLHALEKAIASCDAKAARLLTSLKASLES
jgi:phosphomannomutase